MRELCSEIDWSPVKPPPDLPIFATAWQRGRRKIPRLVRARVFAEKGRKCRYCPEQDVRAIDHTLPVIRGGSNKYENLEPICETCNTSKGSKTVIEWFEMNYRRLMRKRRG